MLSLVQIILLYGRYTAAVIHTNTGTQRHTYSHTHRNIHSRTQLATQACAVNAACRLLLLKIVCQQRGQKVSSCYKIALARKKAHTLTQAYSHTYSHTQTHTRHLRDECAVFIDFTLEPR